MDIKTINKEIEIKATKEKVWEVLTRQPFLNVWLSAFMEGSVVKGEIKDGAQIIYSDGSSNGVAGKVTEYKPAQELKIEIFAEITNGEPDINNPASRKWEGSYDHYQLAETDGITTLSVETSFPAEFYSDFAPGWEKMLEKVKELAEK
jgi:uncharacterized protein YndB with AHSA1/START domain